MCRRLVRLRLKQQQFMYAKCLKSKEVNTSTRLQKVNDFNCKSICG